MVLQESGAVIERIVQCLESGTLSCCLLINRGVPGVAAPPSEPKEGDVHARDVDRAHTNCREPLSRPEALTRFGWHLAGDLANIVSLSAHESSTAAPRLQRHILRLCGADA